jgi:UDP-2,4-diacetamido-2,4,6-trideoxy-beta-L-altropyranose hydrolase
VLKRKIVFRADGSSKIGMGHVMRCLAMSEMLDGDYEMTFAIFNGDDKIKQIISNYNLPIIELENQLDIAYIENFEAVVIDGYWFDNSHINKLRNRNKKIIQIDDLVGAEFYSDIIINHAINVNYSKSIFYNKHELLVGSDYALLRKIFLERSKQLNDFSVLKSITINMGGADPFNYTLKLLKAINNLPQSITYKINVLIGVSYSNVSELEFWINNDSKLNITLKKELNGEEVIELFDHTSLFICPASTIVYEAAAVGLPIGCFLTADNQKGIYDGLLQSKCVIGLGNLMHISETEIQNQFSKLFSGYTEMNQIVDQQQLLIDGHSGDRIKSAILDLWN